MLPLHGARSVLRSGSAPSQGGGTPANPIPNNPQPPAQPATPDFYEDFASNTAGQLTHAFGPTGNISFAGGICTLAGSPANNGVGLMTFAGGAATNYGNGLFEIRAKFSSTTGNVGSGSGPANVLWPASNNWPGPEIDIGEIDYQGKLYMATHWRDASGGDNSTLYYAPAGHDWSQWHTYSAFLQTDRITYAIDGVTIGVETAHPAPDAAHGGENHCLGILNRSPESTLQCDWVKWTSEAHVLGLSTAPSGGSTLPTSTPAITAAMQMTPSQPGTIAASNGVANWQTLVQAQTDTSFEWRVYDGSNVARSAWQTVNAPALTSSGYALTVPFVATGDIVDVRRVGDTSWSVYAESGPVTIGTPSSGSTGGSAGGSTGGGSTPVVTGSESYDLAGPGGGSVGPVGIIIQGQSNAVFFVDDWQRGSAPNAVDVFQQMLRQLTGLTSSQLSLQYQRNDIAGVTDWTLAAGSATYHYNISTTDPKWLEPVGHTLNTPSTWGNTSIMDGFVAFSTRVQSGIPSNRPWLLVRMHDEYDSRLYDAGEIAVYEAANREFIARWRTAMGGRATSLLPAFMCPVSYASATRPEMMQAIRNAWSAQAADANHNAYLGYGNCLDSEDRGDASHWILAASTRVAGRLAVRIAKWLWANGYAPNNLDWLPTMGPRIASWARVSGNPGAIDVTIVHNRGTDLIVPSTVNLNDWEVLQNGSRINVTSITRQDATTLRLGLASYLSTGGTVTLDYGANLSYNAPATIISDDWHTSAVSKPALAATVTNLGSVVMILDRTRGKIAEGAVVAQPGTTGVTTGASNSTQRGRPKIVGNTVLTDQGTRMRGATMALDGPGTQATNFAKDPANWTMIRGFGLNVIRVDIPLSLNNLTLSQQQADIDTIVANAANSGMYIMLMNSTATGTYSKSELTQFWTWAAPRYANQTHVLFEVTNEPKYDAASMDGTLVQDMADIYRLINGYAPNTLIGVLDFAAVPDGPAAVAKLQQFAADGGAFPPAFAAVHPYWNTTSAALAQVKAAYPVMSTEIVYTGGIDDVDRLAWCEDNGISWISLCGRWGDMTNSDGLNGASIAALRDRIIPTLHSRGYNWSADTVGTAAPTTPPPSQNTPPPSSTPTTASTSPYFNVAPANSAVVVSSQTDTDATVTMTQPVDAYADLLSLTPVNTTATGGSPYYGGQPGFMASQNGRAATNRAIGSGDVGSYTFGLVLPMSDGSTITKTIHLTIS